jgi:hypothetical protein
VREFFKAGDLLGSESEPSGTVVNCSSNPVGLRPDRPSGARGKEKISRIVGVQG